MRRETFETLAMSEVTLFYLLIPVVLAIFAIGVFRLVRKYRRGRGRTKLHQLFARGRRVLTEAALHRRIARGEPSARLGHLAILYGFVALLIATTILMVNDDLLKFVFGIDLLTDGAYFLYSFLSDVFGLLFVVGISGMMVRRLQRQRRYDYTRPLGTAGAFDRRLYVVGDWVFLLSMLFLGVTGFVIEAYRIAVTDPSFEVWSIVGWTLSRAIRAAGVIAPTAEVDALRHFLWWGHAIVAFIAIAAIPYTKAVHMLTSPASIGAADPLPGRRLPAVDPAATLEEVGYRRLADVAPVHLLNLDGCTRCGLCHVACPALVSGAPLSPRDLVLDLREAAEGAWGTRAALGVPPRFDGTVPLVPAIVLPETLWSCTTCLACVEACPVGIEHVPVIAQMRRQLVEAGELDEALRQTLEHVATAGNSFGAVRRTRSRWTRELGDAAPADARRTPVDLLWFVGDFGSFDTRAQEASRALARVLALAGVSVGLLHDAERTAGCDVRRVGEEALWADLAAGNIATLAGVAFDRIVTADPHTFHTLRTEYSALPAWQELVAARGCEPVILHHTQLLDQLLDAGQLQVRRPLELVATYHDPCYLGRYGGVYDSPRSVLKAIGVDVRDMPRNRASSFCCGAGGGVIWMKESPRARGFLRPAEQRIQEALELGVTTFVVACPKDAVMFTEAITATGCGDRLTVREVAELVLEAVAVPDPLPGLLVI